MPPVVDEDDGWSDFPTRNPTQKTEVQNSLQFSSSRASSALPPSGYPNPDEQSNQSAPLQPREMRVATPIMHAERADPLPENRSSRLGFLRLEEGRPSSSISENLADIRAAFGTSRPVSRVDAAASPLPPSTPTPPVPRRKPERVDTASSPFPPPLVIQKPCLEKPSSPFPSFNIPIPRERSSGVKSIVSRPPSVAEPRRTSSFDDSGWDDWQLNQDLNTPDAHKEWMLSGRNTPVSSFVGTNEQTVQSNANANLRTIQDDDGWDSEASTAIVGAQSRRGSTQSRDLAELPPQLVEWLNRTKNVQDSTMRQAEHDVIIRQPTQITAFENNRGPIAETPIVPRLEMESQEENQPLAFSNQSTESIHPFGRPSAALAQHQSRAVEDGWGGVQQASSRRRAHSDAVSVTSSVPRPPPVTYIPVKLDVNKLFEKPIPKGDKFDFLFNSEINVQRSGITGQMQEMVPTKWENFDRFVLCEQLMQNVQRSNYEKPTPIQQIIGPLVKNREDIVGCAMTGTGKTAAYLIPIINDLLISGHVDDPNPACCSPKVLIVTPTRELAVQVHDEARRFCNKTLISCKVAYGGTHFVSSTNDLKKGTTILVATMGRLLHLVGEKIIMLDKVKVLILDEGDRMMEDGSFLKDIQRLVNYPDNPITDTNNRLTLMFSATFPGEVQLQAAQFLKRNYVFVTVGEVGEPNFCVVQNVIACHKFDKKEKLMELLSVDDNCRVTDFEIFKKKTLIFVERRELADMLATYLCECNIRAASMNGDRAQEEREQAILDITSGRICVLVASGVAERGLDIRGVDHVINYDMPRTVDQYVHRIGRTGRIGNVGLATSFFDENVDGPLADSIAAVIRKAGQEPPPCLVSMGAAQPSFSQLGRNSSSSTVPPVRITEEEAW